MNEDQVSELRAAYPLLYGQGHPGDQSSWSRFGFECCDGWFVLLHELAAVLEPQMQALKTQGVPAEMMPRLLQVKEKFGGLRFYMTTDLLSDARAAIAQAVAKSTRTCELCGLPGQLMATGRHWQTVCPVCAGMHGFGLPHDKQDGEAS